MIENSILKINESGKKANAMTCPLIKKADGSKFGKTEEGNIWLDKSRTSSYKFYQFWLNTSDEDALSYIKIFTFLSEEEVTEKIEEHIKAPHLRVLQRTIAEEVTRLVHGEEEFIKAQDTSQILFGKATSEAIQKLDRTTFLELFEGVPLANITRVQLKNGIQFHLNKDDFQDSKEWLSSLHSIAVEKEIYWE